MQLDKKELRDIYKKKRKDLDDSTRFKASVEICKQLFNHSFYKKAKTIGFYVSLDDEVETILLIEQALKKKRIAVPKVEGENMNFYRIQSLTDLDEGSFHVFEPTTPYITRPNKMDLIVVPFLSFNKEKYRLGYGKAFYDKYLKDYKGHTIGLAFSTCECDESFQDEYDIPLEVIITENKIYE